MAAEQRLRQEGKEFKTRRPCLREQNSRQKQVHTIH